MTFRFHSLVLLSRFLKHLKLIPVGIIKRCLEYPEILRKPFDLSQGMFQPATIPLNLSYRLLDVAYLKMNRDRFYSVADSTIPTVKFEKQVPGFQYGETWMLSASVGQLRFRIEHFLVESKALFEVFHEN